MKLNKINISSEIKKIKIDVGLSYNAPVSQKLLEHDEDVFVIGIEPNPESVHCILNKNVDYGYPIRLDSKYITQNRFKIFQIAIDDVEDACIKTFYSTDKDPGCSSLYKPKDNNIITKKIINVECHPLSSIYELIDWNQFNYIEWLKIDAQGNDLNILKSSKNWLSDKTVYVTAEPENNQYYNCENNNFLNINEYMISQGFIKVNNLSDPTYINKKFIHLKDKIYLWQ